MFFFIPPLLRFLTRFIKHVEGLENIPRSGGFIIAANHNNHLDSFLLSAVTFPQVRRTVKFLTRDDLLLWKLIGRWGARELNVILIDRNDKARSLKLAHEQLQQGNIIGNYPEGQCNNLPKLLKAKSGTARLALSTGLPVIPVGLSGGPPANTGFRLFLDLFTAFPNSTTIKFGVPIKFDPYADPQIPQEIIDSANYKIMTALSDLSGKSYG